MLQRDVRMAYTSVLLSKFHLENLSLAISCEEGRSKTTIRPLEYLSGLSERTRDADSPLLACVRQVTRLRTFGTHLMLLRLGF